MKLSSSQSSVFTKMPVKDAFNLYFTLRPTPLFRQCIRKIFSSYLHSGKYSLRNLFLQISSSHFLVTALRIIRLPRRNASGISFQLLPGPISQTFPLLQLPPIPFSYRSFAVFIFYAALGKFVLTLSIILFYHFCYSLRA
jgi:hypothetical protein